MEKVTVSKEFVIRAHEAACSSWKQEIEKEVPELFEKLFKVGDWVVSNHESCDYYEGEVCRVVETDTLNRKLIGHNSDGNTKGFKYFRKATHEEIKEHLIKEAEKRGVWNVPINCLYYKEFNSIPNCSVLYDSTDDALWSKYGAVYTEGEWTEVVPKEMTKEQIEKELGYKITIK